MRRISSRRVPSWLLAVALLSASACGGGDEPAAPAGGATLPNGLLLALSQFEVGPDGKVLPKPGPALLEMLALRDGTWQLSKLEDPDSNVFHKAMVYTPPRGEPHILTLGGSGAFVKLWTRGADGLGEAELAAFESAAPADLLPFALLFLEPAPARDLLIHVGFECLYDGEDPLAVVLRQILVGRPVCEEVVLLPAHEADESVEALGLPDGLQSLRVGDLLEVVHHWTAS